MKFRTAIFFLLIVSAFSNVYAQGSRLKYLIKLADRAEEARIDVIIEVGHTLFKRYCPSEHSLMNEYLRQIVQKYPKMNQAELDDQKQGALVVFSEKCVNKPSLVAFSENLNRRLETLSGNLSDRAVAFIDREDPEIDLEVKNVILNAYYSRELSQTFNMAKILGGATLSEEFDSPDYFSYLNVSLDLEEIKETTLHPVAFPQTVETREPAPSQSETKVKSGRCEVCNKNLRLIPFKCSCEGEFCASHQMPENHACTFDFKTKGKKRLQAELVKVEAKKL